MKLLMAMSSDRRGLRSAGGLRSSPGKFTSTATPLRDIDAREIQLERSAEVIQGQVEYPVSLEAAKAALKKVSVQDKKEVRTLVSGRGSPSPKNYLQHLRDANVASAAGSGYGQGHRPRTAPTVETLTGKWIADDFLS